MSSVSQDGLSGSIGKGERIDWFEAVRFLDWYCKEGRYGRWTATKENVALDVFRTPRFSYAVNIQGETIGYGQSVVDEATAKRRAELDAAIYVSGTEPKMRARWIREKELIVRKEKAKENAKQNAKKGPSNEEILCNVRAHTQSSATLQEHQHPEGKQAQVTEVVSKVAHDLLAKKLESVELERDVLKDECEQLRAEFKLLKEEQDSVERIARQGCQNCQGSAPEPSASSTESSLSPFVEIATPQEVSLQLLNLQFELSRMKLRLDMVENRS